MKKLLLLIGFSLNIIISQSIVSVEPNSAVPGSSLWVTITGEGSHFVVSDTTGISNNVESVMMINMNGVLIVATSFTAVSETVLEAFFAIPEDAPFGACAVEVQQNMGYGSVTLANGFSIAESVLLSVEPNSAAPGSSLWVTITGEETHFVVTDTTGVSNNVESITINRDDVLIVATSFTAISEMVLEAFFEIPEAATTGAYDVEVQQNMGHGSVTLTNGFNIEESVSLSQDIIPTNHLLHQNFPNPFNPTTNISFRIAHPSISSLIIYDVSGNLVRELKNGFIPEGEYNLTWDGRSSTGQSVASGLYIYQLKSNSYIATKKMLMIK